MRILLAIRVFVAILFGRIPAEKVDALWSQDGQGNGVEASRQEAVRQPASPRSAAAAQKNDAILLLATLQRESRLIDLVQEPLEGYSDEQVGAAARNVLRDSAQVLQRLFALKPIISQPEGSEFALSGGFDTARFRLTGHVGGDPPFRGRVAHHGWEATHCELPTWTGSEASRLVVAPAELELPGP